MDTGLVIEWSREALRAALLLGAPALVAALAVALIVGMFQTVTQMQDPVVSLVPRLLAALVVCLALMPWLLDTWLAFTVDLISTLPGHL
jgi:flagellar biosynthetic protein FliQ